MITTGHSRPPEKTAPLMQIYRDAWQSAGHDRPLDLAVHYHCVVAEDRAEALRIAEAGLHEHNRLNHATRSLAYANPGPEPAHPPVEHLVEQGRILAGTPDDCAALLQRVCQRNRRHGGALPVPVRQYQLRSGAALHGAACA